MEENKRLSKRSGYCQGCACVDCMTSAISLPNCVFAVGSIAGGAILMMKIVLCVYEGERKNTKLFCFSFFVVKGMNGVGREGWPQICQVTNK